MRDIFKEQLPNLKSECSPPERKLNTGCTRRVRNARWLIVSLLAVFDWTLNEVVQWKKNK